MAIFLKIFYKKFARSAKKFFYYFKRFLSGFFFNMFIKLQNKGENTKLIIKDLFKKNFFAAFFCFFLEWDRLGGPPLDPPLLEIV